MLCRARVIGVIGNQVRFLGDPVTVSGSESRLCHWVDTFDHHFGSSEKAWRSVDLQVRKPAAQNIGMASGESAPISIYNAYVFVRAPAFERREVFCCVFIIRKQLQFLPDSTLNKQF